MNEIILKSEISNEEIIKNKGNKKCIFYSDDICRNGDRTRDCLNCARVEYHSLYSLNWDNQERLQKQLKRLQAENDGLKSQLDFEIQKMETENEKLKKYEYYYLDKFIELKQALEEIREIANVIINGQHITDDIEGHLKDIVKNHILTKINEVLK